MGSIRGLLLGLGVGLALAGALSCGQPPAQPPVDGGAGTTDAGTADGGTTDGGDAGEEADAGAEDAGADGGAGDGGALTLDEYCAGRIPALCDLFARCGMAANDVACEASHAAVLGDDSECRALRAAEADGRITFDGDRARSCLDELSTTLGCAELESRYGPAWSAWLEAAPACPAVVGNVPRDGQCYVDAECAASDYCTAEPGACPGTCLARKGVGAVAFRDGECQAGLYLYSGASDGTCRAFVQPGLGCAALEPLAAPQSCSRGHFCDPSTELCTPLTGASGNCTFQVECQPHLECRAGTCQTLVPYGGACSFFGGGACAIGLSCSTAAPFGSGSCDGLHGFGGTCWTLLDCEPDLYCDGANFASSPPTRGTCNAKKAAGATCLESGECQLGLHCAGTNGGQNAGTCAAQKGEGAPCDAAEFDPCLPDLYCDNGTCAPLACRDATP